MIIVSDYLRYTTDRMSGKLTPLISAGFIATAIYRFGHYIYKTKYLGLITPVYLILEIIPKYLFGISISRKTSIGKGLYIGHHGNIIISKRADIGEYGSISHEVTIGVSGAGDKYGAPKIGNNVYFAPGAKVFGKINIGDNVKIGANAVVYKSVPANSIVVVDGGCKIISQNR